MLQFTPQEARLPGTPVMPPQRNTLAWNLVPDGMGHGDAAPMFQTAPQPSGQTPSETCLSPALEAPVPQQPPAIPEEDWDALFRAVQTQLRHAVGEQLGALPAPPAHSVELAATLVQAVVLDCVGAMDQLHAALKQERSQRPTA